MKLIPLFIHVGMLAAYLIACPFDLVKAETNTSKYPSQYRCENCGTVTLHPEPRKCTSPNLRNPGNCDFIKIN
jgi:hypothetical protein